MERTSRILVWDPLVRLFHWLLASCFAIAYFVEDERLGLHLLSGSALLGLVIFRLIWGIIGTRYARFTDFTCSARQLLSHLRELSARRAERHLGHTPAGSAMIFVLLAGLLSLGVSGAMLYGLESSAPFYAGLLAGLDQKTILLLEQFHGWLADALVVLVLLHVSGVLVESALQKENLIRSMITGYKTDTEEKT